MLYNELGSPLFGGCWMMDLKKALEALRAAIESVGPDAPEEEKTALALKLSMAGVLFLLAQAHAEAAEALREAASLYEEVGLLIEALASLNNLIIPLKALGRDDELLATLERCLALYSELKGKNMPKPPSLGYFLVNVASELARFGRVSDVYFVVKEALEALGEAEDAMAEAQAYSLLANACFILKRFEEGREAAFKAMEASRQVKDMNALAYSFILAAQNLVGLGKWKEAERLTRKAVNLYRQLGSPRDLARSLYVCALVLFEMGEYEEALQNALESYELCSSLEESEFLADVLVLVGLCSVVLGDWKRALSSLKEAVQRYINLGPPPYDFDTILKAYAESLLATRDSSALPTYIDGVNFWLIHGGVLDQELREFHRTVCQAFGVF